MKRTRVRRQIRYDENGQEIVSAKELARRIPAHHEQVFRRWAADSRIPATLCGSMWFFNESAVKESLGIKPKRVIESESRIKAPLYSFEVLKRDRLKGF